MAWYAQVPSPYGLSVNVSQRGGATIGSGGLSTNLYGGGLTYSQTFSAPLSGWGGINVSPVVGTGGLQVWAGGYLGLPNCGFTLQSQVYGHRW